MNSLKVLKIKNHQNLKINDFTVLKLKHTAPDCNAITITSINNFINVSKKNSQNIIVMNNIFNSNIIFSNQIMFPVRILITA